MLQNGELQVSELESNRNYEEDNCVLYIQTYAKGFYTTKLENISDYEIEFRTLKGEFKTVLVREIEYIKLQKCATLEQYEIELGKRYLQTGYYIRITSTGCHITEARRVTFVDGLYIYVDKLNGKGRKIKRTIINSIELVPIKEEDIKKLNSNTKVLEELETHKNYYEDENKVIKLVNEKGVSYLTTIFDVATESKSIYGRDIEHRHVNLRPPFDEVKVLHLKPLEEYGVMPLENYYDNDKILKVTLENGDTEYLKDIQTITVAYFYVTSFDSETKTIKREDVVNIEILDMVNGVIQEVSEKKEGEIMFKPPTLKGMLEEKSIETDKDYSSNNQLIKVTTDTTEMHFKNVDNVNTEDKALRGIGEDDRPYMIPHYRILDIEVVPMILEGSEPNEDGLKLSDIEVGKNYGTEDKVINIVTEDGDYLVYGVTEVEGDFMYCMTTDYDNIEIPLRDIRHVAMHTRYNLEKWGIVSSLDYSIENMYIKVTFNNGETRIADSVGQVDVIYYRLLDAVGKPVKVSCENVKNMEVYKRGNHMPVPKGIKLLMVGNVKIGTDYSEQNKEIHVKTSNGEFVFKLSLGLSTGADSLVFLTHEDKREYLNVNSILKIKLVDSKTIDLNNTSSDLEAELNTEKEEPNVFKHFGVEEGKNYTKEVDMYVQVTTKDHEYFFSMVEEGADKGYIRGYFFSDTYRDIKVSDIKHIGTVYCSVGIERMSSLLGKTTETEDSIFTQYGVEEGKDYRKESKLLQVKLEDNILVFTNLESDMDGWVAGRQFGSITTSVPVSKIKEIKVVDISDLM
ncbi:hypothetical protein [Bacillus toyonensis]|uniref:hypothetical protein n=1 Tax=Bacillus toyonensis TaxID=155322 RepID=UPI000BF773A3|nr:hypothetical protein [Bacillus toyonensis]PGF05328.1 hypothetical protein COM61_02645 [Bacillus toyonensis]